LADFPPKRWHLLLAAVCIAAVYLVGVTGRWWPTPDSALYLGLGRSLADGEGYRFNGTAHNIVTPGLPLILVGLRTLFGPGFRAPNLFMAMCGLTCLLLVYLAVARMSDRRTALAVVLTAGLSYTFFNQSHRILTDAPFAALFWAVLYAYLRYRDGSAWWLVPVGLLSAAAIVIRAPGILILGSLAVGAMLDRPAPGSTQSRQIRKRLLCGGVIAAAVAVVGVGFYMAASAAADGTPIYVRAMLNRTSAGVMANLRDVGAGLMQLPLAVSEMISSQETYLIGLPVLLLVVLGSVHLWRRGQRLALIVMVLSIPALAFYGKDHAIRSRYLLPIHPLLLLACMEGLCWSVRWSARRKVGRVSAKPAWFLKAVAKPAGPNGGGESRQRIHPALPRRADNNAPAGNRPPRPRRCRESPQFLPVAARRPGVRRPERRGSRRKRTVPQTPQGHLREGPQPEAPAQRGTLSGLSSLP
jgi:4-amino-4-deoxy-L-arabinose transferase-like glycosyltransferase